MIANIVKWGVFLFFISNGAVAQPPDEEILFHFNNRVDILKTSFEKLQSQNSDILNGNPSQQGFCQLTEKHTDYQRFTNLLLEKLAIDSYENSEFKLFALAIKTEFANRLAQITKRFNDRTFSKLEIKKLHTQYVLIKIHEAENNAEIVFLAERLNTWYPILDIIDNGNSHFATLQLKIQDFLKTQQTRSLTAVAEHLNLENSSAQNFGTCDF